MNALLQTIRIFLADQRISSAAPVGNTARREHSLAALYTLLALLVQALLLRALGVSIARSGKGRDQIHMYTLSYLLNVSNVLTELSVRFCQFMHQVSYQLVSSYRTWLGTCITESESVRRAGH